MEKEATELLEISNRGKYLITVSKLSVKVWDIDKFNRPSINYTSNSTIHSIKFNPVHYWFAAATDEGVSLYNYRYL